MWNRINDTHQETRLEAIVGLALRKDNDINEIIKREIEKQQYGTLLFEAIIETKNKDFLPILEQQLKPEDSTINREWMNALKNCIEELKSN